LARNIVTVALFRIDLALEHKDIIYN
jgi:hypothetical protein